MPQATIMNTILIGKVNNKKNKTTVQHSAQPSPQPQPWNQTQTLA
jgi:hypothetical protein